ncbi:MAG: cytochrome P450 [Gammaproteobacteria bacterium]|nr:cytochrome P450 [Gammaproteobacteria bacterium]
MNDFNHPGFFQNPYPTYHQLQQSAEPLWIPHTQRTATAGVWLFSRYEDALSILKDNRALSKDTSRVAPKEGGSVLDRHMMNQDPPNHTRLRHLVAERFSPQKINGLEEEVTTVVRQLLESFSAKREIDFVAEFATALPVIVISRMVGIPAADYQKIREWSMSISRSFDSALAAESDLQQQRALLTELVDYIGYLIEERRRNPQPDLITALIAAQQSDDSLSYEELLAMVMLLLFAGHETTVSLLGSGLFLLCSHPEQLQLLQHNRQYLPLAIEEMLRYESPIQRTSFRVTASECNIGGKELQQGEQVCAIIGAANRDETVFKDPDSFNIKRSPNHHLAFGFGLHGCLGSSLARLEARITYTHLLERFPQLRLVSTTAEWEHSSLFRRLKTLPITV